MVLSMQDRVDATTLFWESPPSVKDNLRSNKNGDLSIRRIKAMSHNQPTMYNTMCANQVVHNVATIASLSVVAWPQTMPL